ALRTDLYGHLLTLDLEFYDRNKTGELMAHSVNDINAVRMAIGFGFIILIDITVLGIAGLIMMFNISPKLTVYALIPLPILTLISTRFGRMIHRYFEKVQESFALLTERVRENLSGIRIVKIFVQEEAEKEKFQRLSQEYVDKNKKLIRIWGLFFPLVMFFAALGEVLVLWLGGRLVISGEISIGSFVAFIAYLQILVWPMMAIGWAINLFQRGGASQQRLQRIFDTTFDIKDGNRTLTAVQGGIELKNVSFRYTSKNRNAIDDVSIKIEPRQMIGITGPIGCGKTTLINLLLRLYEPQAGAISIDGNNIKDLNFNDLRYNIAYVPQDTFLFSDTIAANIAFGRNDYQYADLERVTKVAHIYDEIMALPDSFKTQVGERGITLSGGQKQRVALARALLLDRPILILDDAFSSVDAETERKILGSIRSELKSRTSIIISHRVFVLQDADSIFVLDNGRITEQGTHQQLLTLDGLYREIFEIQQIEKTLGAD
ncbi:hypothetical protein A2Y85_01940, partial [candidate division WOR-3 bacterium RBG_13_43_14]